MSSSTLDDEIRAVFSRYEDAWNEQRRDDLITFWDDDADPVYLAEEQDDWITGRDGLERYFVPNPGGPSFLEALLMHFRIDHVRAIGDEHAFAAGWVRHDMKLKGPRPAWGGDARITAVLRRTREGWRFVSYTEAHMTPLNYMQKLYERNVSDEFKEYLAQRSEADPA
jgi:hypothetical protein